LVLTRDREAPQGPCRGHADAYQRDRDQQADVSEPVKRSSRALHRGGLPVSPCRVRKPWTSSDSKPAAKRLLSSSNDSASCPLISRRRSSSAPGAAARRVARST